MLKKLFNHNIGGDVRCVMVLSRFLISFARFNEKRSKTPVGATIQTAIGSFRLEYEYEIEYITSVTAKFSLRVDFAHRDNCQETLNASGLRQSFQRCSIICKVQ